jgi:hypothetical protein
MTTSKDRYAEWDAAYLLGALSPADRREYEEHLTECDSCSAAVVEIAAVPGFLARVPSDQVMALLSDSVSTDAPPESSPNLLPALLSTARSQRRRSRAWTTGIVLAAAAVAAVLALIIPNTLIATQSGDARVAASATMTQVVPSALTADIRLVSEPWGTRVESTCRYNGGHPSNSVYALPGTGTYALVVTARNGVQSQISTWTAGPGATVEPTGTTNLNVKDIASVEIREVPSDETLLRSSFD